jgi:outer membrane protein assembly factor BamB
MTEGFIYTLDQETGKLLWKYQTKAALTHSNPLFVDNKVLIGDESGFFYAIDAQEGQLVWQKKLEADRVHSSPAYEKGVVFVGTETRNTGSYLYALDARDGRMLWQFEADRRGGETPDLIHGTPTIADGVIYFGSENGWFYALNKNDGKVIWKKLITTETRTKARQAAGIGLVGVSTAPALGYGKIFVSTWEGKFLALSQKDGSILWEYKYGDEGSDSSAVLGDGKVCLGSHYLDFYCFNQENGKVLWKKNLGGPSAALANGILVVPNALAAAESPGPILLAFADTGIPKGIPGTPLSSNSQYLSIILLFVFVIILVLIVYKYLKSKRDRIK